jgi:diaminohydroxyphosphoribosylaminopyrimidine deaminase / 5-amino-6-(5-phosphoribosylamino)uracil reductase
LDVRLVPTQVQPLRVVLDSQLTLAANAAILTPPGRCLVATTVDAPQAAHGLQQAGAEVIQLPSEDGGVDLRALMALLVSRQINELHVEAGARLNGALLRGGWVDELLLYQAPMLIGEGPGMAAIDGLQDLEAAPRFVYSAALPMGSDLRIVARRVGSDSNDSFAKFLSASL